MSVAAVRRAYRGLPTAWGVRGGQADRAAEVQRPKDEIGDAMTPEEVVRAQFDAYRRQDRAASEALLARDLTFTSPQDDHIDRDAFFERCFPTADRVSRQELLRVAPAGDEDVFIMYEYDLKTGGTHRNAELITVVGGQIVEIQVFFGGAAG
ncbi:nuclear transport factor 2 family protein [Nocardioides sp. YIM 152588]|uniref:nuclear transport factor 2 family protein n=1 Tax=Nocardioides sp. YIM 152588 TaxID=3158259 RepID=UPI0032E3AF58